MSKYCFCFARTKFGIFLVFAEIIYHLHLGFAPLKIASVNICSPVHSIHLMCLFLVINSTHKYGVFRTKCLYLFEWQLECSYNMTFNGTTGPKESHTTLLIYDEDSPDQLSLKTFYIQTVQCKIIFHLDRTEDGRFCHFNLGMWTFLSLHICCAYHSQQEWSFLKCTK